MSATTYGSEEQWEAAATYADETAFAAPSSETQTAVSGETLVVNTTERSTATTETAALSIKRITRPGISAEMLAAAGVHHVEPDEAFAAVGYRDAGLLIPYRTIAGAALEVSERAFARLRLTSPRPGGAKYLSPAKSGCQAYFPPGLRKLLLPGCVLGIVEGEFKSMALVEAGLPCVGIGGITCASPRNKDGEPELLPDLARLIAEVRPSKVAFIGDSDTALIADFSRAAVKLAGLISAPVVLPRIPLDAPGKGADDLREVWGSEFAQKWQRILDGAVHVGSHTMESLATALLDLEEGAFRSIGADAKVKVGRRLVKLAVAIRDDALAFERVVEFAARCGVGTKGAFRSAVKTEAQKQAEAATHGDAAEDDARFDEIVDDPPLFFDGQSYWRKESDGNFGKICREDTRLHLGVRGLSLVGPVGQPSAADRALHRLQQERRVTVASPICGRPTGVLRENGLSILVTKGPRFIEPKAGEFPTIEALLASLFGRAAGDEHAVTQSMVFVSWLKLARNAVRHPDQHLPGHALGLIGPKDCGKSLLQSSIITRALGGRVADPILFFTGSTAFNSDLWHAEHLAIGDKGLGDDGRERAALRDAIKQVVAAPEYKYHAKGREAFDLRPIWRISISANDDPESAASIPTLDGSFSDKIIYLRCHPQSVPFFDENDPEGRERFSRSLNAELPAFLAAVDAFEIPEALRKGRFGLKAFHHPYIIDLLNSGSPLVPFADAVESWIQTWDSTQRQAEHSAVELYGILDDHLKGRLKGVSSSPARLGHQLAGLSAADGWRGRVIRTERRTGGREKNQKQLVWRIRREAEEA